MLCRNLHRPEPCDAELRVLAESRIRGIRHVLVLLAPWDEARAWCQAELQLASGLEDTGDCSLTLLTAPREAGEQEERHPGHTYHTLIIYIYI